LRRRAGPIPDATGLELIAQDLGADVAGTVFFRDKAAIEIVPSAIRRTLAALRDKGFTFLCSVHGVDYYPQEPRLGVHSELLDM
jgi:NADH-quinone oxidoreductase subunit C